MIRQASALFIFIIGPCCLMRGGAHTALEVPPPPTSHQRRLFENAKRVKLQIKLDRDRYLAGESLVVILAASNPGSEAVEIFDPFSEYAAGLDLLVRLPNGEYDYAVPDGMYMRKVNWTTPTSLSGRGRRSTNSLS